MTEKKPEGVRCPSCGRQVRSGIRCAQTFCPFEKVPGPNGHMVIGRPLKRHWLF